MSRQFKTVEELRKSTRTGDGLIASISHDLRTPLNIIIGFAELMIDEVPGPINANQKQCLDDILSSSRRLLELINTIIDPS